MKTLTYSDSPFFSNWSQTYFTNLTLDQHIANNNWLMNTLTMLTDDGILYVPVLNKQTGEVFKPASWNAPAKHVRYDLRRIKQRRECFSNADWAGSYLYMRG